MTFKIFSVFQKLKNNKHVRKVIKNRHFQIGGPFISLVVLCWFLIKESQTVRFEFRKVKSITRNEWEEMGLKLKGKPLTLEEEYEKIKDKDFNDWENIRIPRPEGWDSISMELTCTVQNYHWGKKGSQSIVKKFAEANSESALDELKPYAELWMGVHPNGPSYLKSKKIKLSDHLSLNPDQLGLKTISSFGNQLPFLLKILSIEEPLSLQVHPTKEQAKELFNKYPDIYKDTNHKPELAVAITKFEALCGFRPISEIKDFLKSIREFQMLIDVEDINNFLKIPEDSFKENEILMKICFQSLIISKDESVIGSALEKLIDRLAKAHPEEQKQFHFDVLKRLNLIFPKDVGIFCIYWLNYVILTPGQALFLAPNEPHAYLSGDCIECMANSDNVVRAGLTPKFRDIKTLCEMLTYKTYELHEIIFKPIQEDKYSQIYYPPVEDFAVAKFVLPSNFTYYLKERESGSILLVLEGHGKLNSVSLEFGKVLFLPAKEKYCVISEGLTLFQAFCNI